MVGSESNHLLSQYPGVVHSEWKENCAFRGGRSVLKYFESLPRTVEAGELIVGGCIDLDNNIQMSELLRQPNTFYMVLLRDYADWIWSAYNFWCDDEYDLNCPSTHWVDVDTHIRSPSLFHEILEGSMNGTVVRSPLLEKRPCEEGGEIFRRFVNQLWSAVPAENTLILASEDLERDPQSVWRHISRAVGLDPTHHKLKEFSKVRYNSQALRTSKGESTKVSNSKVHAGLYAVSKFQELYPKSRAILDVCWRNDCLWATLITGHQYSACSQGITINKLHKSQTFNFSDAQARYVAINADHHHVPFLRRKLDVCRDHFEALSQSVTVSSDHSQKGDRELKAKEHHTHHQQSQHDPTQTSPQVPQAAPNNRVLILSLHKEDRDHIRNMLYYAVGWGDAVDTEPTVVTQQTTHKMKSLDLVEFAAETVVDSANHCAVLLTQANFSASNNKPVASSHTLANLEYAYISDELVCKVKDLIRPQDTLLLHSIQPADYNTSCVDIASRRNSPKQCRLRYMRRAFQTPQTMKHPVVFLASSDSDMVNTRMVLEHASGIFSGAMETNSSLSHMFPAEIFCGQRMSFIHAVPDDVTIKNMPSGKGVVSLTNIGNKKCNKGMISGFSQALLLARDPFMWAWGEFQKATSGVGNQGDAVLRRTESEQLPADADEVLLSIARRYSREALGVSHAYDRLLGSNFESENVMILSFERLIASSLSVMNNKQQGGDKEEEEEEEEPLKLLQEATNTIQRIQRMNAYLRTRPNLICGMEKIFSKALSVPN
eukprot:gene30618-37862_t